VIGMKTALKSTNLAARFLLELGVLAALGWSGAHAGSSPAANTALAVVLPLIGALAWAKYAAPSSASRLSGRSLAAFEVTVFSSAVAALYAAHVGAVAELFALAVIVNAVLMARLEQ
jgi:hypothetical protein